MWLLCAAGAIHAVIQFPLYEYLKIEAGSALGVVCCEYLRICVYRYCRTIALPCAAVLQSPQELPALPLVACSIASKLVASSVAYPHEVVRARLQVCVSHWD